jgi:hypothetical protein
MVLKMANRVYLDDYLMGYILIKKDSGVNNGRKLRKIKYRYITQVSGNLDDY